MIFSGRVTLWLFPAILLASQFSLFGAQDNPAGTPVTARGEITSVTGRTLLVRAASVETLVTVTDATKIVAEVAAKLSDITPGVYLGTTAQKQSDGTFRASEVHIFADDERGLSEGHKPSSSTPNSTMTNANVEQVENVEVQKVTGPMMTLKYKGGEVKVFVSPNIPIVKRIPGERGMLKAGVAVSFQGVQSSDGTVSASRIIIRARTN